ncbi:hypothetical protein [Lacrimispora sp.]|uniref:hypothetical protein n=1 Tax=Lacrimispora sp. TaxID=2719234 RepID=UPI00345F3EDC
MTNKEIGKMFENNNVVRGDVYPYEEGRSEYWFENSPFNIANFIMQHRDAKEIIVTDTVDRKILNTIGEFIDRYPDQGILQKILPHLIPIQMGEAEPQEIFVATDAEVEEYFEMLDEPKMGLEL